MFGFIFGVVKIDSRGVRWNQTHFFEILALQSQLSSCCAGCSKGI
jgi:hypothetical protein